VPAEPGGGPPDAPRPREPALEGPSAEEQGQGGVATPAQERAILREVIARAPAAIALVWGPEHRVRLVNDRWLRLFPQRGPVLGRAVADAFPDVAPLVLPLLDRVRATGQPFRGEDTPLPFAGAAAHDASRYFAFTLSPIPGPGVPPAGVLVMGAETTRDVRRRRQLEQELATERGVIEVLQRSLLPAALPELPGAVLAARYVPATDEAVAGDWYDAIPLGDARLAVVVGDVAGHGLQAASAMAQTRNAVRAYAVEHQVPAVVLERVHALLRRLLPHLMATVLYGVFEVSTGTFRFASAGHPPPLLVTPAGAAGYVEARARVPLGVSACRAQPPPGDAVVRLAPHSTLVLYTDGLVEERGAPLDEGLERLRQIVRGGPAEPDLLCDHVLRTLRPHGSVDDLALLVLRVVPLPRDRLEMHLPAEPASLDTLRQTFWRWLEAAGAGPDEVSALTAAATEACRNAIRHAYGGAAGSLGVEAVNRDGEITIVVGDRGRWRPPRTGSPARGLALMRSLTDAAVVEPTPGGTVVQLRRRLRRQALP